MSSKLRSKFRRINIRKKISFQEKYRFQFFLTSNGKNLGLWAAFLVALSKLHSLCHFEQIEETNLLEKKPFSFVGILTKTLLDFLRKQFIRTVFDVIREVLRGDFFILKTLFSKQSVEIFLDSWRRTFSTTVRTAFFVYSVTF